ncbi:regulatory protein [Geodermatophilus pulveris]|uniref:Regulatory protein RecX n=1 Tax=Geodermatophilus pulveris TaxID=1564159 RepID=A0A239IFP4_9ACTN|nr:regulatory protein RecX [Geodermatophilus pulveris]SNS91853.1 regulatory protein [Geodermatophilus pulveris]
MGGWPEARERPAPGRRRGRRPGPSPDPDGPDAAPPAGGHRAGDDPGDSEQVARSICLRALTGAARTRAQLADLLARRGIPEDVAGSVLDRFGEVGLIDDAAFARAWVTSRQSGRGLARRALKAELRAKGVDGEVAEQAVTLVDDQDEWDAARRLVQRRLPGLRRVDRATAERRLVGMLARRGYGGGLAGWVAREALDEDRSGGDRSGEEAGGQDEPGLDAWLP